MYTDNYLPVEVNLKFNNSSDESSEILTVIVNLIRCNGHRNNGFGFVSAGLLYM